MIFLFIAGVYYFTNNIKILVADTTVLNFVKAGPKNHKSLLLFIQKQKAQVRTIKIKV